jgi:hypothetical protein
VSCWKSSRNPSIPSMRKGWNGLGGKFDPEAFDPDEVNAELR